MSIQPKIVVDPKDLTPEWVEAVLREGGHDVRVRGCRSEAVGTGQMAHNERIFIDYDGSPAGAPATLVAKVPSPSEESRAAGGSGAYLTEVRFYQTLAEHLSIRVPACYYAELSEDGTEFTLIMEDMAPSVQGDQIAGASVSEIEAAIVNLAGLHAPLWESPRLAEVDWAPVQLNVDFAPIMQVAAPAFLERFAETLSPEASEVLRLFGEHFARWVETQPAERTLVHGDYRLDNLLFSVDETSPPVAAVDWQTVATGSGARDLAYLLGNSFEPEARREAEPTLLETYRVAMKERGVDLSPDQIHAAYRHGTFQGPYVTMLGALAVGQTDRGDAMFMAMAERSAAQIRDLGALELIQA